MGYAAATQPLQLLAEMISQTVIPAKRNTCGDPDARTEAGMTALGRVHSSTVLVPQRVKAVVFCPADHIKKSAPKGGFKGTRSDEVVLKNMSH